MVNQSGTFELPTLLPYPSILKLEEFPGTKGRFCYIIEHYGHEGISCLIFRDPKEDNIVIQLGDWKGNTFDLGDVKSPQAEISNKFLQMYGAKLIELMRHAKIEQALYYITINSDCNYMLADVRISYNKFLGPGMLRDVFGKIIETPKVLEIKAIDDDTIKALQDGVGTFSGDIILKPSKFQFVDWNGATNPLYVEILR